MRVQSSILSGRKQLFTSYKSDHNFTITEVCEVINRAISTHQDNSNDIDYLIRYYLGRQPILDRVKDVRSDVNNKVVINYAYSTTRDIVGYTFGKPIQYTQRKQEGRDAIVTLNDYVEMEDKAAQDQEIATYCSICGVGYRGVFPNDEVDETDDVPFELLTLDPRNTFVVYSYYLGKAPLIGVNYIMDKDNNITRYYIYTNKTAYIFETVGMFSMIQPEDIIQEKPHLLGAVPIVEYVNNQWRMGHWETAISLLDTIDLIASDSVNDVIQFVNSILVAINAEITPEVLSDIENYKMASIKAPQGLTADLKYISNQLDSSGVQILREYLEESYRVIVGIPDRKTKGNGGGDTGEAVKLRDGFQDIEIVARTTEMFFKRSEKKSLSIMLNILKINGDTAFSNVSLKDIDIKFTRNKTDNLQSKVQSGQILNAMALYDPVDITELMDITTDAQEMVERGRTYQEQKAQEQQQLQIDMIKQTNAITNQNNGGATNSTQNEGE